MTNQIARELKSGLKAMPSGELILIRHGPTVSPDRLIGRTDVALAAQPGAVALEVSALVTSPAVRARETAAGMFPDMAREEDARLWEQDFGAWEGRAFADLPDVGALSKVELAELRPEGGENFHDMYDRAVPAVREAAARAREATRPVAVVAHAGILRVALALAMDNAAAALTFRIDHFGAIRLYCLAGGFAVTSVNERLA